MEGFEVQECTDTKIIQTLFQEYSQIKGAESCFVSFEKELAGLASFYRGGALFAGYCGGEAAACAALKKSSAKSAELKRLYIKPAFRGKGYAHIILRTVFAKARELGFSEVTLTTKPAVMPAAYALYKKSGFSEIGEADGTVSMRITL